MTLSPAKYEEAKSYWYEYVRVNGYSLEPQDAGIQKLAKLLDLKQCYLRKMIVAYLAS